MVRWPRRMIARAVRIEIQREAESRIAFVTDAAHAAGHLGRKLIDPKEEQDRARGIVKRQEDPYYVLDPLQDHLAALEKIARPWEFSPEVIQRRRIETMRRMSEEQDRLFREARAARAK